MEAGYSDQPHLNREFREFAGLSPEQYRLARPALANHVAVAPSPGAARTTLSTLSQLHVNFVQDRVKAGS
jgi:AraC-like DNA-binding protein